METTDAENEAQQSEIFRIITREAAISGNRRHRLTTAALNELNRLCGEEKNSTLCFT